MKGYSHGYGMQGEMNPQTKMKQDMTPSKHYKGNMSKSYKHPGAYKGSHDMSPKTTMADEEAVWQNMR